MEPIFGLARTWHGRLGQALELGEPGMVDGTTANSLAADHRGPRQDDQIVKTKPPSGDRLRILDQGLGSTRARWSRNRLLEGSNAVAKPPSRVGWTALPLMPNVAHFGSNTRFGR